MKSNFNKRDRTPLLLKPCFDEWVEGNLTNNQPLHARFKFSLFTIAKIVQIIQTQYQRIVLIRTFLFIIARFYPLTRVFQIFYHRKKIIGKEAQQKHPDSIYYYRAKFLIIVTHVEGKNPDSGSSHSKALLPNNIGIRLDGVMDDGRQWTWWAKGGPPPEYGENPRMNVATGNSGPLSTLV